ncbi:MAG: hypothetical protein CVV00_04200 [Firmicutes bacterium HGW-Firmicutes-5]|nr:MAG: hypothetical protein CVV00_04200 [Firmicutes bacterium HGW-Firmicutes-5]
MNEEMIRGCPDGWLLFFLLFLLLLQLCNERYSLISVIIFGSFADIHKSLSKHNLMTEHRKGGVSYENVKI